MQVTCWSGEWRWHVAMQCGRDRAATRSPCSDSQRRAATRSPRSPHSSSRPQLGSPGSGEQGAVRGCGGGAKRQGRKKWKWTAASYRFYKLQARSSVGIFVFCCGGGLYTARAQENLRASPPREGGGGEPPRRIVIETIGIAFVVHAVEAVGATHFCFLNAPHAPYKYKYKQLEAMLPIAHWPWGAAARSPAVSVPVLSDMYQGTSAKKMGAAGSSPPPRRWPPGSLVP
jgi:hypothetical protein